MSIEQGRRDSVAFHFSLRTSSSANAFCVLVSSHSMRGALDAFIDTVVTTPISDDVLFIYFDAKMKNAHSLHPAHIKSRAHFLVRMGRHRRDAHDMEEIRRGDSKYLPDSASTRTPVPLLLSSVRLCLALSLTHARQWCSRLCNNNARHDEWTMRHTQQQHLTTFDSCLCAEYALASRFIFASLYVVRIYVSDESSMYSARCSHRIPFTVQF